MRLINCIIKNSDLKNDEILQLYDIISNKKNKKNRW